jgi:hypothetical protein
MEQRLALSATPATSTLSFSDLDWSGSYLQTTGVASGGNIAVDVVFNWGNAYQDRLTNDAGFIGILNGQPLFTGPVFSKPEAEGALNSNEAGSTVTPIPQPQIGKGELSQGLIAVAEIFRPTSVTLSSPGGSEPIEHKAVETAIAATSDDSWKSTSLARGRDVYFEVAALTDDHEPNSRNDTAELSSKIAPLIYQQTLQRRESERAAATTSQEPLSTQRSASPLPSLPREQAQPADAKHSETPKSNTDVEKNQRTAQDGEHPQADEVSQATDSRDHVFAVWNDAGDELSDEAVALRTENQQDQSAKWPALAVLAATGWIARNRRSRGVRYVPSRSGSA